MATKNTTWKTTIERMTTAQRDLAEDGEFAVIFNTTTDQYEGWNGSGWTQLSTSAVPSDDPNGYGYYVDDEASDQTFTTTATPISINKLGGATSEVQLPLEIRGSGTLWDGTKMTPIGDGDAYDIRLDFMVESKTSNPSYATMILDIGGGATPTIPIVQRRFETLRSTPFSISMGFPIFTASTFLANGGQFFIEVESGTITVSSRAILIKRDHKAS